MLLFENASLLVQVVIAFISWNFLTYAYHRVGHLSFKGNFLRTIHLAHHRQMYDLGTRKNVVTPEPFKLRYLLLYFDSFEESLDVWLGQMLPAIVVFLIFGGFSWYLCIYVYIYEVFFSETLLDHNPRITNPFLLCIFAWGQQHLEHHRDPSCNFSFSINIFDYIFGTYKKPKIKKS
jgi:sterol desaturase/sphingolipid hydroxylase (fatty acid hydroxylase superfamily)